MKYGFAAKKIATIIDPDYAQLGIAFFNSL